MCLVEITAFEFIYYFLNILLAGDCEQNTILSIDLLSESKQFVPKVPDRFINVKSKI